MGCCWSSDGAGDDAKPGETTPLLKEKPAAPPKPAAREPALPAVKEAGHKPDVVVMGEKPSVTSVAKPRADAAHGAIQAGKMTGQALLQMAQNVPILAPVAFLVGAVASSASEAVILKADCSEFQIVIEQLERILLRAESLEEHGGEVDEVREALSDALQLMEKMKCQGALASFWVADSQRSKFEELRDRIKRALDRLTLGAAVDTNVMARAKFKQSQELARCVEGMGGVEAVLEDPAKMESVYAHMGESEKVLQATIQRTRMELKDVGSTVITTQRVVRQMKDAQSEGLMQAMRDAELQKMRNEVLQQQVKELKAMVSEVRDCMRMFPVPAKEPERMVVMNQGGFLKISPKDSAFKTLQRVTKEASLKWGVMSMANMIGGNQQFTAAGYMPQLEIDKIGGSKDGALSPLSRGLNKSDKIAVDFCGIITPRKMSHCQHVVNGEKEVVCKGTIPGPVAATPADLMVASKVDPVLESFLTEMQNNRNPFANAHGSLGKERAAEIASSYLIECQSNPDTMFYAGVPIKVEDQVVGSFCLFGPNTPKGGFGEKDLNKMKSMVALASEALERQLNQKRKKAIGAAMQKGKNLPTSGLHDSQDSDAASSRSMSNRSIDSDTPSTPKSGKNRNRNRRRKAKQKQKKADSAQQ